MPIVFRDITNDNYSLQTGSNCKVKKTGSNCSIRILTGPICLTCAEQKDNLKESDFQCYLDFRTAQMDQSVQKLVTN